MCTMLVTVAFYDVVFEHVIRKKISSCSLWALCSFFEKCAFSTMKSLFVERMLPAVFKISCFSHHSCRVTFRPPSFSSAFFSFFKLVYSFHSANIALIRATEEARCEKEESRKKRNKNKRRKRLQTDRLTA